MRKVGHPAGNNTSEDNQCCGRSDWTGNNECLRSFSKHYWLRSGLEHFYFRRRTKNRRSKAGDQTWTSRASYSFSQHISQPKTGQAQKRGIKDEQRPASLDKARTETLPWWIIDVFPVACSHRAHFKKYVPSRDQGLYPRSAPPSSPHRALSHEILKRTQHPIHHAHSSWIPYSSTACEYALHTSHSHCTLHTMHTWLVGALQLPADDAPAKGARVSQETTRPLFCRQTVDRGVLLIPHRHPIPSADHPLLIRPSDPPFAAAVDPCYAVSAVQPFVPSSLSSLPLNSSLSTPWLQRKHSGIEQTVPYPHNHEHHHHTLRPTAAAATTTATPTAAGLWQQAAVILSCPLAQACSVWCTQPRCCFSLDVFHKPKCVRWKTSAQDPRSSATVSSPPATVPLPGLGTDHQCESSVRGPCQFQLPKLGFKRDDKQRTTARSK